MTISKLLSGPHLLSKCGPSGISLQEKGTVSKRKRPAVSHAAQPEAHLPGLNLVTQAERKLAVRHGPPSAPALRTALQPNACAQGTGSGWTSPPVSMNSLRMVKGRHPPLRNRNKETSFYRTSQMQASVLQAPAHRERIPPRDTFPFRNIALYQHK